MERKEVIRLAQEADLDSMWDLTAGFTYRLERFASLVAAAERDRCVKIAETPVSGEQDDITMEAKDRIAAAIRALP